MQKIGIRIRKWREERNLSREELADLSGLHVPFIEALEEKDMIPSISPLLKIARALGVRLGTFMDDQVTKDPIVTKKEERVEDITMRDATEKKDTYHYASLGKGKSDRNMEPFIINVMPDDNEEVAGHQGEEFIYVLSGQLKVIYGRNTHILNVGDSIYYNSIVPHAVMAIEKPAQILAVIYYPM